MLSNNQKFNAYEALRRSNVMHKYTYQSNAMLHNSILQRPTAIVHRMKDDDDSSSPLTSNQSSAKGLRGGLPHNLTSRNTKKFQREFASLVGCEKPSTLNKSINRGRKFDFNAQRNRVNAPLRSNINLSRVNSPTSYNSKSSLSSPIRNVLSNRSRVDSPLRSQKKTQIISRVQSPSEIETLSSRSSTNNSIVLKSIPSTPSTLLSASKTTLFASRSPSPSPSPSRLDYLNKRSKTPIRITANAEKNTSSFLCTPRTSPFSIRKSYNDLSDKENKAIFISDLSSVSDPRASLTPSPYKVRERCLVCYRKFVIK